MSAKAEAEAQVKLNDFKNIFSLDGKVAVVTGGSRGLGLHAASGYTFSLNIMSLQSSRDQLPYNLNSFIIPTIHSIPPSTPSLPPS